MLCKEVSEKLVKRMEEISDLEYDKAVSSLEFTFSDQKVEQCYVLPYYGKIRYACTSENYHQSIAFQEPC